MKHSVAFALLLAGFLASLASAQVPAGVELEPSPDGLLPSVATTAAGDFVVAWRDNADGDLGGIMAARFDATGVPEGAAFRVNAYTTGCQGETPGPSVGSDALGNFVVVWASMPCYDRPPQDGSGSGIYAQRYDASGAPRGLEFRVNSYTTGEQVWPAVASDAGGPFVVAWESLDQDGSGFGVFAQRYDASGTPRGGELQVNLYTPSNQFAPAAASDAGGNFVVAWESLNQDGDSYGVFAQRYDATGLRRGGEFQVNTHTSSLQMGVALASAAAGDFVVVWNSYGQDGSGLGVFAQRYGAAGAPLGAEFQVNTLTTGDQGITSVTMDVTGDFAVFWGSTPDSRWPELSSVRGQRYFATGVPRGVEFQVNAVGSYGDVPSAASDGSGNLVVAWQRSVGGVRARRFGGVVPAQTLVDPEPSAGSDGNGVLEPGESVEVVPFWRNVNGAMQAFDGNASSLTGPAASGVSYMLTDAAATYGSVPSGSTAPCTDCYQLGVGFAGTRPATHWDAALTERLTPDELGQAKQWSLHLGDSFGDVPRGNGYYRFAETLLHRGVTAGCGGASFCPSGHTTRQQMAIFVLRSKEGSGYLPSPCGETAMFADVPTASLYCPYVEELARRGITSGCGGGNFCPAAVVQRDQMAAFVLRTLDPAMDPPACGTPLFADVPATSPYCKYVEELVRRGVVSGCGGGNYCPTNPVTRGQMSVFLTLTFGLSLYGS